jgi:hypothetical protein
MINGIRMIAVIFLVCFGIEGRGLRSIAYAREITVCYNHGNHYNPINPGSGSDKISNPAANKINPLRVIPKASKNNQGNLLNLINPGSDK